MVGRLQNRSTRGILVKPAAVRPSEQDVAFGKEIGTSAVQMDVCTAQSTLLAGHWFYSF